MWLFPLRTISADYVLHQFIEGRVEVISSEDAVEHGVDSSVSEDDEGIGDGCISGLVVQELCEFSFPCFEIKAESQAQFVPDDGDVHFLKFLYGI